MWTHKLKKDNQNKEFVIPRRISVVVCAHNEETTIETCLRSIFIQTLKPHEVLVVLDRCTDRTPSIVASFRQLTIIEKKVSHWRNSYTENLEIARKRVNGDVYAIIDADVCLSFDYLEKTVELLKPVDTVLVSGRVVFRSSNPNFLNRIARLWEELFWVSPSVTGLFYGCALLTETRFLTDIGGFSDVPAPDAFLQKQARHRALKHKFAEETVAFHFDEDLPLRETINRQIEMGKRRRAVQISFVRTVLFAMLRLKPFTISGWLTDFFIEKGKSIKSKTLTT
jgi:hypothetical protein